MIESGHQPPPSHDPSQLPLGDGLGGALALSLTTATVIGLRLGPALVDRLAALGVDTAPLAGLALHELIVNAIIHGNLQVASGRSREWADIAARQVAVSEALADRVRADRMVTIAVGWRAGEVVAVIADEGAGYAIAAPPTATRSAGRGLRLAGMVGHVEVFSGGRQTLIAMDSRVASKEVAEQSGRRQAAPIVVISPHPVEARDIAGWLRDAGLDAISTVRTCDEAIFLLGCGRPGLLIIDEAITVTAEQRLLRHIGRDDSTEGPPLIRLISTHSLDPLARGRTTAAGVIRKPLLGHDVVLRVGSVLQRPDLLERLDHSRDRTAAGLDIARQMQIGLLPAAERLRTVQEQCCVGVAAFYRPGEAIGGDFWAIRSIGKGPRFALTLVDFAGHGLSAALNTFRLHALLSDEALPRGKPTRMAAFLNERLHVLLPRGQYATMVYLDVDPASHLVAWCGAGGPQPLLVAPDRAYDLDTRGLPLGVRADAVYRRRWMRLPDAGVLAVFSDGLYESGGYPEVPRQAIADALIGPASLAARGELAAGAREGAVRLEALRDSYPCHGYSDDVLAVCVAFGSPTA